MTKGEMNLRSAATGFALEHGLLDKAIWTSTGLEIEFVEPLSPGKNRRFMRCTIALMEVDRCNRSMMDLLRIQWKEAWTRVTTA